MADKDSVESYTMCYFTVRPPIPIILTQSSRHGGANNTKVYIPRGGAGLLEGAGRETSAKVTLLNYNKHKLKL